MKKMSTILLLSFGFMVTTCNMLLSPLENQAANIQLTGIAFTKSNISVEVGTTDYIPLTIKPSEAQPSAPVEYSFDTAKISIQPDTYGVIITGLSPGNTYIKASSGGISASCTITVVGEEGTYIGTPYIYSNFSVIQMTPGTVQTISASLYGGQVYELEEFSWTSSKPEIASISYSRNNGIITAHAQGISRITASHPRSPYPYSFTVFSHSGQFVEPYLTTETNIVYMNKEETLTKNLSVSPVNLTEPVTNSKFVWETVPAEGPPVVSVAGNGPSGMVTALGNGIAQIRVSYEGIAEPLDILVRVTTAVPNVYVTTSTSTLEVTGSMNVYSISAGLTGYDGFVDNEAFLWDIPESASALMDYTVTGNTLYVTGKLNGTVKARVAHALSDYYRSFLIILRRQEQSAVDSSLFITTSSNYVQTKVGAEPTQVSVTLTGGLPGDENNLIWSIDNAADNEVILIETTTGRVQDRSRASGSFTYGTLVITPRSVGTATIVITHPKIRYQSEILVRVYSENAQLVDPAYLVSDTSLVKMLNGQTREVTAGLTGNYQAGDENNIRWHSDNASVFTLTPSSGSTVVIHAVSSGTNHAFISATHPKAQAKKQILVLSADTQTELDAMKGIYADSTYFRLNEGGSDTLELLSFGLEETDISALTWSTDNPSLAVVSAVPSNRLHATVTAVSAGNAVITARLSGSEPVAFHLAVLPEGETIETIVPKYLTTVSNAVLLPEADRQASITVTGVNIDAYEMTGTSWVSLDTAVATVSGSSGNATVTAVQSGTTKIIVSNPVSTNVLTIDIKVGALYEWEETFDILITTEQDTYTLVKGESITIGAALTNTLQAGGFSWQAEKGAGLIEYTGSWSGTCFIQAKEAGMVLLTIKNSLALSDKQIFIVISNTPEELGAFPYLTTAQNVVTLGKDQNTTVAIQVKNNAAPLLSGYHWLSSDPSVVSIVDSGQMAVFYAHSMGTAVITVTHDDLQFPLKIIANVVDPVVAANNPYITSPSIVTLTVGDSATTISAELIGGLSSDVTGFIWEIADSTVASMYAANDSAQVRALKEGVTQIHIRHSKANGIDRTIMVIGEPRLSSEYYITTTESIIRMSPTDTIKTITATLVNGSAHDAYAFRWWADSYDCINFNYTGASAVITPLSVGTTTIHISHPRAQYQKDVIIYVSQYSELAFSQTSISIPAGSQTFVPMEIPVSGVQTKLSYRSTLPSGGNASSIVSANGTSSVCIVNAHSPGTAVITAQLIAVNSGIVQGSAELLVNVTPSTTPAAYLNFSGSTIITLEKNVTRSLNATLAGQNAVSQDSKTIQWVSSDQSILKITPSSLSGTAVNDEIQVTALKSGEATLTLSHEKASSNIILYFIVPGENTATVTLDRTTINMMYGETPVILNAAVSNGRQDDAASLQWSVRQDTEIIRISGSGRQINIMPVNLGAAVITVKVPSSGHSDTCTVVVDQPHTISFDQKNITLYPGEMRTLHYTASPASLMSNIIWTVKDNSFVQIGEDDHNGTLTIYGKKEGGTILTGVTSSNVSTSTTILVKWGDSITVNKSLIRGTPINNDDGTFDIGYEISPVIAEIRVSISDKDNVSLKPGTYARYFDDSGVRTYVISPPYHTGMNAETGVARGTIHLEPTGETIIPIGISGYNPIGKQDAAGDFVPYVIPGKNIVMQIYHTFYTFTPVNITKTGNFSRYDSPVGAFVIGDGEALTFSLEPQQDNATVSIATIRFDPLQQNGDQVSNIIVQRMVEDGVTKGRITHTLDYKPGGSIYGYHDPLFPYTDSVVAVPIAGTVTVVYNTVTGAKEYRFPLYVEVRNCSKDY
jgi:hypothetical protein